MVRAQISELISNPRSRYRIMENEFFYAENSSVDDVTKEYVQLKMNLLGAVWNICLPLNERLGRRKRT